MARGLRFCRCLVRTCGVALIARPCSQRRRGALREPTTPLACGRSVRRAQRGVSPCVRRSPGLVRPWAKPAAPARHLTARSRRGRPCEREVLGRPSRGGRVRRDQPGRDGKALREVLVRLRRPDRRPRADARTRGAGAAVAADRPEPHLRPRHEHGWPGDAAPRRAASSSLAGAVAMDSVTDLGRRYGQLPKVPCDPSASSARMPYGHVLQRTMEWRSVARPTRNRVRTSAERAERWGRSPLGRPAPGVVVER